MFQIKPYSYIRRYIFAIVKSEMIKINDKNNLCYIAIKMWNIQIKLIPKKERNIKIK